jgi:AraC family transcriptional regulator of adaptative response/methylated-DNA-[protein]-cysteine methyltransferase
MNDDHLLLAADACWEAVVQRDAASDGQFVYAVRTTGIYCRPSCPARRPQRERVSFYALPAAAEVDGFRPCRRCHPQHIIPPDPHVARIAQVCAQIAATLDQPQRLDELAALVGLSPQHFQRIFTRLLGISPREYADALRVRALKTQLRQGEPVSVAIDAVGYGSASRVYEHADAKLGMTPSTYQRGGIGMEIRYSLVPSPLGNLLVAATARGVCAVRLGDDAAALEAELHREFASATLHRDDAELGATTAALLAYLHGQTPHVDLPLDVQATAFQQRVWQALQAIPYGETRTYGELAKALGNPKASRAVGRACATNPVSLIVPCHRAVGSDGKLHGFRWGLERKAALLELEQQQQEQHIHA